MGGLIASVREAEERLAGLARALQSAWEEEVAEASSAREAARRSLQKADAMAEAAGNLGRQELAARLAAVADQLRSVEERAGSRLEALMQAEQALQLRLEAPPARTLPATAEPPPPSSPVGGSEPEVSAPEMSQLEISAPEASAPEVLQPEISEPETSQPEVSQRPSLESSSAPAEEMVAGEPSVEVVEDDEVEIVSDEDDEGEEEVVLEVEAEITAPPHTPPPPVPPPPPPVSTSPLEGLTRRVGELERVAGRLPPSVFEPALEELVALTRLAGKGADPARTEQAVRLRARLRAVAARRGKETTFGLSDDEFADWATLAAQARARRQAEVERIKATRPRPGT